MLSTLNTMDVSTSPQNASPEVKKTSKRLRTSDHVFTLGIEEELQLIDPETRELRSHIQQILADGKIVLKEQVKPELHQSIVEIGTGICSDARDARRQITALRNFGQLGAKCSDLPSSVSGIAANPGADFHNRLVHLRFDLLL